MNMGEPPRLPAIYLPWEKSVAYFMTLCAKGRRKVLANDVVFEAVKAVIPEICRWHVIAGVIMPEHVHWLVAPAEDRDLSVGDFSNAFNHLLRKNLGTKLGNGSVDASIVFCVGTKARKTNGSTSAKIQCVTGWFIAGKNGLIIWTLIDDREANSFPYRGAWKLMEGLFETSLVGEAAGFPKVKDQQGS